MRFSTCCARVCKFVHEHLPLYTIFVTFYRVIRVLDCKVVKNDSVTIRRPPLICPETIGTRAAGEGRGVATVYCIL